MGARACWRDAGGSRLLDNDQANISKQYCRPEYKHR